MLTGQIRLTFSIYYFCGISNKVDLFRSLSLPRDYPMQFYKTHQGLFSILIVQASDPAILHLLFWLFEKYYIFIFCHSSLCLQSTVGRFPTWYTVAYCLQSNLYYRILRNRKKMKNLLSMRVPNKHLRI